MGAEICPQSPQSTSSSSHISIKQLIPQKREGEENIGLDGIRGLLGFLVPVEVRDILYYEHVTLIKNNDKFVKSFLDTSF